MDKLCFGTGGTPVSSRDASTIAGIERIRELGLDCMELEFVRGVRMSGGLAGEVKKRAGELDVRLSAHGPYFINLNSRENPKVKASIERILATARVGYLAGAESVTFHAAYYMKDDSGRVYGTVKTHLKEIIRILRDEGNPVFVRPETTGKLSQFGTLDEIIKLSQEVDGVLPCVDFSHMHARYGGKYNSYDEFAGILSKLEEELGKRILSDMHCHVQGIEYTKAGERAHLNLSDSDFNYVELIRAFREFKVKGLVICESPNLEEDAMLLNRTYETVAGKH